MRLLLVTNGLTYGGAERIVEALAVQLSAAGTPVHVVAVTRDGPIGDALRRHGISVRVLGIRSPVDATAPLRLARIARDLGADIVHSHLEVSDITVALAAPAMDAKTVSTVHNLGLGALSASRWKRALWTMAIPRFDRVLAVSRAVANAAPVDATVVHPSVISRAAPMPDRGRMRRKLGIAEEAPLVMAVGRLSFEKGFDLLGAAAESIAKLGARVLLIGDGPERAALLRHPYLELLGARPDAGELMAAADVVVCPSRTEGFPQTPLQAMFASVPVVATGVGGMPEVVVDGETGVLVKPEDVPALADAIEALVRDRSRAQALGTQGRARVLEAGFTIEAMVARHREVYRELLSG